MRVLPAITLLALCCRLGHSAQLGIEPADSAKMDYEDYPGLNSTYKLHTERVNWDDAWVSCQQEGAQLAVLDDQVEAIAAANLFAKYVLPTLDKRDFLSIGINDKVSEGFWVSVLGDAVALSDYNIWAVGRPNKKTRNKDDCGSINRVGQLNDIPCSGRRETYPFLCEKK